MNVSKSRSSKNVPNLNGWPIRELSAVTKDRAENDLHQLINIGSCGLHVVRGTFKSGSEATNWKPQVCHCSHSPARPPNFPKNV